MKLHDYDDRFFEYAAEWMAQHPGMKPEEAEKHYNEMMSEWLRRPAEWLNGICPGDYFRQWSDPGELIDMLEEYDRQSIGIPEPLYARVIEIGTPCLGRLIAIAQDPDISDDLRGTCISLSEQIGGLSSREMNLRILLSGAEKDDLAEQAADNLKAGADLTLANTLMAAFDTAEDWTQARILEICLAVRPTPEGLYDRLITKLNNSPEQRAYYAGLLGDLGDDRAIEPLRRLMMMEDVGYLDFLELRNAIEMLGGEADEERNFYGDPDYEALRSLQE